MKTSFFKSGFKSGATSPSGDRLDNNLLFCSKALPQDLVLITDETLTVNSISAINGNTRNTTRVTLPEKTKGYIYRITIYPKGPNSLSNSLFDILQSIGSTNISLASSFAKYAIQNGDNNSVDAFIFDNVYDAENFVSKNDANWSSCKTMLNRVNCCIPTKDCISRNIYFGFRNNNTMQGLNVRIEIVALVDQSLDSDYKYSYSIANGGNKELKYYVSTDNYNWNEIQLRPGYKSSHSFDQNEIYFKIITDRKSVVYSLSSNDRYKIFWNSKGYWDLMKY